MRSLAHIEIVESLRPIDGADKIEVARVLGWECVVKKGEFKVGEKIIYVEVDSIMPPKPEYEFLRERNFRIKTIKLRGQISQGLVLPFDKKYYGDYPVGHDITEELGITKYLSLSEREEEVQQTPKHHWTKKYQLTKWLWKYKWFRNLIFPIQTKGFPSWVSVTDEERIQNIPYVLEKFKDSVVYVAEKVDYQSVTFTGKLITCKIPFIGRFLPKKFQFIVCSRKMITNNKNSLYWKIAQKYNIEHILRENPTLTIQGEQGDTRVQGNKYGIKEPRLFVFNIIDHEKHYHYNINEILHFCNKYNLEMVPLLFIGVLSTIGSTVQEVVEFSKGESRLANIPREGVVIRCVENGKKLLSFKAINPDFLLRYKL